MSESTRDSSDDVDSPCKSLTSNVTSFQCERYGVAMPDAHWNIPRQRGRKVPEASTGTSHWRRGPDLLAPWSRQVLSTIYRERAYQYTTNNQLETPTCLLTLPPCLIKQNRSTEGFSKLKRSVDMTSSGKNGLSIRTNTSPNGTGQGVRRSKRPLLASRTRCNVLWKPSKFGMRSKSVLESSSVISSQIGVMSDQLRVSLYMAMSQNVM